jgi:methionyl-tRNA formyltransferase
VRAILEGRETWGISCHQLDREFDSGAVLAQELFPMSQDECHETLEIKLQMAGIRLTEQVALHFAELWASAKPQGEGSYWKKWTDQEQTVDFTQSVESVLRHIRAFGLIESIGTFTGSALIKGPVHIRRASGWTEKHSHPPGKVVHVEATTRAIVVAVRDGYVALTEWVLKPA